MAIGAATQRSAYHYCWLSSRRTVARWLSIGGRLLALTILSALAYGVYGWGDQALAARLTGDATPVVVVSAASLGAAVAPEAVVSAFGTGLAAESVSAPDGDADPDTPGVQLPTSLGGTQVKVNGEPAQLYFVSPTQINFVLPKRTAPGAAEVAVTSNNVVGSRGTVEISAMAPALFTVNGTGQGVPVGYLQRFANGSLLQPESFATFSPLANDFIPKPIIFGAGDEEIYLTFFVSGIRGAACADANRDGNYNEMIHLAIDGQEVVPDYAGSQPQYPGFDQINVKLPRSLSGRGQVKLAITATGFAASNTASLQVGGPLVPSRPQMQGFSPATVLAGDELTINGANFSDVASENTVEIIDSDAQAVVAPVLAATATQLKVRVPFGVGAGIVKVTVRTPAGELAGASQTPLGVRTSISGFVQNNDRQSIPGVKVRLVGYNIAAETNSDGVFTLADVPVLPGNLAVLEIDPTADAGGLPFPVQRCKMSVRANRDNLFTSAIELQSAFSTLAGSATAPGGEAFNAAGPAARTSVAQGDGVRLELPDGAEVRLPDGTIGNLALTVFDAGRTPFDLPAGYFSSAIAQLTPFRATITPGGRLSFPNTDNLPSGSMATLFRFDQTPDSSTLGSFIAAGQAKVSDDGRRVETDANAITGTSYHFVSVARPTATLVGRVADSDGRPRRWALVQARGQSTFTNGLGGYVLRDVPVLGASDRVTVEVSFLRANRRVARTERTAVPVTPGAMVNVAGDIVLPPEINRPPVIIGPSQLFINQGETSEGSFIVSDPDDDPALDVKVANAEFATVAPAASPVYKLRLAPGAAHAGNYTATLSATDGQGAQTSRAVYLYVNRPPVAEAQSVSANQNTAKAITLAASDPDGDLLRFTIVNPPAHGSLTGAAPNLTYTPEVGYVGPDGFSFKASDGRADGRAAAVTITVVATDNPSPTLASLSPNTAPVGGVGFTLTVNGTGFIPGSQVRWNGSGRLTNYATNTRLTAQITSADIAAAGPFSVTVFNPAPGGGTSNALGFSLTCSYAISPASQSVAAGGGSGSVNVTAGSGCAWTASSQASWITIPVGISGSGNGTVGFSVLANTGPARTGTLTAASHIFTINQASGCTYSISPSSQTFSAIAGQGTISVTTANGCTWSVSGVPGWVTILSGSNGSGNGTVSYSVAANNGPARNATLTVAGQSFTIAQASGCTYSISPSSQTFASGGGSGSINVTTVSGCGWSVTGQPAWITITSGTNGVGSGMVNYSVTANNGPARNATLTVAGQSFTIAQASGCTYSISPGSQTFASGGGSGSINVTTVSGCGWSVTGQPGWISINSGANGVGSGTVNYSVTANASTSSRAATMTVAGQSFTVTQSGACPTPTITSLNPSSATAGGSAFTVTVSGSNFAAGAVVRWNGSNRTTSFISSTTLTAQISAADIAAPTTASVTVALPCGSVSSGRSFQVTCPTPALSSLNPGSAAVGGSAFTLTVSGSNFTAGASVRWNGSARSTTFVNSTTLTAQINAADIATTGTASVTVTTSCGTSGPRSFTVNCPIIVITPSSLPNGLVNSNYNQTLSASGGTGSYSFSVTSGSLPTGLNLSPTGVISGTTTTFGSYTFTVRATPASGCPPATRTYTIKVCVNITVLVCPP